MYIVQEIEQDWESTVHMENPHLASRPMVLPTPPEPVLGPFPPPLVGR